MLKRILSGVALAVIMIPALLFGGWLLYGLCVIISLIGIFELLKVRKIEKTALAVAAYITAVAFYVCLLFEDYRYSIFALVLAFMFLMGLFVFTFPKYKADEIMWSFFAIVYVALMLSYIYEIRMMQDGVYMVWLIFVSSWGNDTFAYFTGVCIGKHKMAPVLSPKKSIEGAVGGIAGATVLGLIYGYIVSRWMSDVLVHPVITFGVASFLGSLLAIIGDLAASAIKRNYNVKDYGNLIPGHGGIMDRFDSVIFTAPAVYIAVVLLNNIYNII